MTRRVLYTFFVLCAFLISTTAMAAIPVEVSVGKSTVVTLKENSKRVSISDPSVAELILISPTEILLNGKKVGATSLIIWNEEGKRTFFDLFVAGDVTDLRQKLKDIAPEDEVDVSLVGTTIVLKGTIKNTETIKRIETLSSAYGAKVINLLKIKEPQQVLLEVKVAQIDRTKLMELGLSFLIKGSEAEGTSAGLFATPDGVLTGDSPGIDGYDFGDIVPQIGVSHFTSGVAAFLRALSDKGLAKVLAEPNLVVRSGEEGEFLAGSRIPVQVVRGVGADSTISITFEEVGIKLNFKPEVLEDGIIRLKIDPAEVSNVVQFLSFQGAIAPEIDTRQVSTSVDLKEHESLILAGLLNEEMRKNISKIPLLGDIPILGAVFRTTRDEIETTELAFFITPSLVKPIAPGVRPELPGEASPTPEEKMEFQWIPVPKTSKKSTEQTDGTQGTPQGEADDTAQEN